MNFKKPALDFSGKGLTEFPKEVFEIPRLYKLNLSNNKIKEIPKEIESLKYLETLNLSGNDIKMLYAKFYELNNLRILILNNNKIANISTKIEKLKNLKVLNLANNKIFYIPKEVAHLPNLSELNLTGNDINELPLDDWSFPSLRALWVGDNPLKGLTYKQILNGARLLNSFYCYTPKINSKLASTDEGIKDGSQHKGNALINLKEAEQNDEVRAYLDGFTKDLKSTIQQTFDSHMPVIPKEQKSITKPLTKIFISYSHKDDPKEFLEPCETHINSISREISLEVWSDTKIEASEKWKDIISKELKTCDAAVLLVSANFLASSFIRDEELPVLLKAAEERGVHIHVVIIKHCTIPKSNPLSDFQWVNNLTEPVVESKAPDRIWSKLTRTIMLFYEKDHV